MNKKHLPILLIIIFLPLAIHTANHEYTHIYFAEEHNCNNIKLHGPNIQKNYVAAVSYKPSTCDNPELLNMKQEMTEAVGYQKTTMIILNTAILLTVYNIQRQL